MRLVKWKVFQESTTSSFMGSSARVTALHFATDVPWAASLRQMTHGGMKKELKFRAQAF